MIVDYFLIRKTDLYVEDFMGDKGKYSYNKGFNPAALITYFVAGIVGIVFFRILLASFSCQRQLYCTLY